MTVTAAPSAEPVNIPPRIRVDVSASAGETATTVMRNDPDGTQHPVRTTDGAPLPISAGSALIYDYEPPFSSLVSYTTLESPSTVSAELAVDASTAWLIHPGLPSLSLPILLGSVGDRTYRVQRGLLQPMGRRYPVPQTDGQRKAAEFTISIITSSLASRDDVLALFDDAGTLLLNVPNWKGYGINAEYVSIGDIVEKRPVAFAGEPMRSWELPLTVVDRPAGGTQAQRTLADLLAYPTLAALKTAYPTLAALAAGP